MESQAHRHTQLGVGGWRRCRFRYFHGQRLSYPCTTILSYKHIYNYYSVCILYIMQARNRRAKPAPQTMAVVADFNDQEERSLCYNSDSSSSSSYCPLFIA